MIAGLVRHIVGNTSARAEKSHPAIFPRRLGRKYLRACGEELSLTRPGENTMEIPPRVRRRVPQDSSR
ncbi:hypothetical protein SAMN05421878_1025 [Actinobaculum suis]|uniref:Uncharacterized protein n=1 Tax=Actinobaculum suis TaxID=1657 RepID=A0A1G6ZZF8_9ACTO|nr:hypothetical protein SAMN05421878_1025 [Actinobaculum suis]